MNVLGVKYDGPHYIFGRALWIEKMRTFRV